MASNRSLLLFGIGDGGGGPHVSHLEQLDRLQRCRSLPRIDAESTPEQFFDNIKSDFCRDRGQGYPPPAQWVGELYLELHQGSLTSQALVKKQNRQCENELRGVDALLAYCWIVWKTQEGEENYEWLKTLSVASRAMWKDVLLNQFHDVLRK